MTLTIRDIREREKEEQRKIFEPFHGDRPAVIKSVDGNTRPSNQPAMTWVAFYNQPESRVLVHNPTANDVAETPVWVGPENASSPRLIIKGIYYGGISTEVDTTEGGALGVSPHAKTQQYPSESNPGPDKILVYQPALQPLKMTGNGTDLTVTIQPHLYTKNGRPRYFSGGNLDLTSSVPGTANTKRKTLVYLDENTNVLSIVDGGTVSSAGALLSPLATLPVGGRMIGYVELTNGQTSITTATHIEDWRDTLKGREDVTGATTINPHIKSYTLEVEFLSSATGTVTLSFQDANVHDITLTGNTILAINDPPSNLRYGEMKIIVHQDSTGGYTLSWPVNVWWPGATTPTMSPAADAVDMYEIVTLNGGLYYLGRTLAAYGPSPATITVDVLTLSGSALSISIGRGVIVNALALTGSAETITVVGGPISVTMNALTLAGTAETCTVV